VSPTFGPGRQRRSRFVWWLIVEDVVVWSTYLSPESLLE